MKCSWNRSAARIFAEKYVSLPNALTTRVDVAEGSFLAHIPALCKQYAKIHATGTSDCAAELGTQRHGRRKNVRLAVILSYNLPNPIPSVFRRPYSLV